MELDFWLNCWEEGKTGFDQESAHPFLTSHFEKLSLKKGSTVFVPLCGKSIDMIWLKEQGYQLLGVEISPLAIKEFYHHFKIPYQKEGNLYKSEWIDILCDDFFSLDFFNLQVDAIYDRASFIALPQNLRERYKEKMEILLKRNIPWFLTKISYDSKTFEGPPFSIQDSEIENDYKEKYKLTLLDQKKTKVKGKKFVESGMSHIETKTYLITDI